MTNRDGESYDFFSCATFRTEEQKNGWRTTLEIPRVMLGAEVVCFGIKHEWTDKGGTFRSENYPAGDFPNEQRLNLGFFTPDRLILLDLNPAES